MSIENFETYLRQGNMAENTVAAYLYAVREYYSQHKELNKRNCESSYSGNEQVS